MSKSADSSRLEAEVKRQIAEGLLPSTVERRLLREGHPEADVKRLVDAERQRIEEERRKARSQTALNNAKIVGLVLVALGLLLPWTVVMSLDPLAGATTEVQNGFASSHLVYGVVFLALSIILLVLLLFTRTRYDPDNTRDRVVFGLTTLFEALLAGWWAICLSVVLGELAAAREMSADTAAILGDLAADLAPEANLGLGIILIPIGALILLVAGYLEIAAVGGGLRIAFTGKGREEEAR